MCDDLKMVKCNSFSTRFPSKQNRQGATYKMNSSTNQQWALLKITMMNVPNVCSEQRHEGALFIRYTHINMDTLEYIHGYTPQTQSLFRECGCVVLGSVVGFLHLDN